MHLDSAPFNLESAYGSVKAAEETEDLTVVSKNFKGCHLPCECTRDARGLSQDSCASPGTLYHFVLTTP